MTNEAETARRKRQVRKLKQSPQCSECGRRESAADLLNPKQYWDVLSSGARQLAVAEGPETLIVSTSDRKAGRSAFIKGSVSTALLEKATALAGLPRPAGTLVEVGSGFGGLSVAAVHRALFAKAIAVEPSPEASRLLHANVALNGLAEAVTCVEAALASTQDAELKMAAAAKNPADARVVAPGADASNAYSPTVTTLDAIAPGLSPDSDLIVIDACGYEGAVLAGASAAIAASISVMLVFNPLQTARYDCFAGIQSLLAHHGGWYDLGVADPERQSGGYLSDMYRSSIEADASATAEILVTAS